MRSVKRSFAILFSSLFAIAISFSFLYALYMIKQRWVINSVSFKSPPIYIDVDAIDPIIRAHIGKSFLFTDLNHLYINLLMNDWVKDVEVSRVWPDSLEISFHEVVPLAIISDLGVITAEGKVIETNSLQDLGLPVFEVEKEYVDDAFTYYFDILSKVSVVGLRVDKISHDAVDGWRVKVNKDFELVVGHGDVPARVTRFVLAYQRKLESMASKFAYIDLRYTNGVAIGWKTTNN